MTDASTRPPFVTGGPRVWLRVEGAAMLVAATLAYVVTGPGWLPYVLLFFVPDIAFAAYALGPRPGAMVYNLLHTCTFPLLAVGVGMVLRAGAIGLDADIHLPFTEPRNVSHILMAGPLIWLAHIGFDRMLGYGLKYPSAFRDTHLGRL